MSYYKTVHFFSIILLHRSIDWLERFRHNPFFFLVLIFFSHKSITQMFVHIVNAFSLDRFCPWERHRLSVFSVSFVCVHDALWAGCSSANQTLFALFWTEKVRKTMNIQSLGFMGRREKERSPIRKSR